jgi:3D (Asp-Asp-Asp) domain-containing protein
MRQDGLFDDFNITFALEETEISVHEVEGKTKNIAVEFAGETVSYDIDINDLKYISHIGNIDLKAGSNFLKFSSSLEKDLGNFNLAQGSYIELAFPKEFVLDPTNCTVPQDIEVSAHAIKVKSLKALSTANEWKLAVKNINIDEEITCYEVTREEAPYNTVRVANPDMLKGTERVVQEGVVGIRSSVYEVVWSGGAAISRQFVEEIDSTAVDEIIEYGTSADEVSRDDKLVEVKKNEDGSGTLVFASGTTVNFSGTKSMTATAYTAGHGGVDYTTATGTFVKHGVVAVDKRVIPLGTRMYIVTNDGIVYGLATAEDTGVRGNVIDLYHETYRQCIEFGRRSCTVYILEG